MELRSDQNRKAVVMEFVIKLFLLPHFSFFSSRKSITIR